MSLVQRAAHGRCLAEATIAQLRLIARRMGQRFLVIEHRAEIAHISGG
jgi:hypothetical protein